MILYQWKMSSLFTLTTACTYYWFRPQGWCILNKCMIINLLAPWFALSSSYQKWGNGQVLSWHSIQTILFMYAYLFQWTHDQIYSIFIFTWVPVISNLTLICLPWYLLTRQQTFVRSAEFSAKVNMASIFLLNKYFYDYHCMLLYSII
jgi:hypothetical protein